MSMRKLLTYIKRWNTWRKHNGNGPVHHIFVLLGIIKSPTFMITLTDGEWEEIASDFEEGLRNG